MTADGSAAVGARRSSRLGSRNPVTWVTVYLRLAALADCAADLWLVCSPSRSASLARATCRFLHRFHHGYAYALVRLTGPGRRIRTPFHWGWL